MRDYSTRRYSVSLTSSQPYLLVVHIANTVLSRLARRGGVKRISATIYHEIRHALKSRVQSVNVFREKLSRSFIAHGYIRF